MAGGLTHAGGQAKAGQCRRRKISRLTAGCGIAGSVEMLGMRRKSTAGTATHPARHQPPSEHHPRRPSPSPQPDCRAMRAATHGEDAGPACGGGKQAGKQGQPVTGMDRMLRSGSVCRSDGAASSAGRAATEGLPRRRARCEHGTDAAIEQARQKRHTDHRIIARTACETGHTLGRTVHHQHGGMASANLEGISRNVFASSAWITRTS